MGSDPQVYLQHLHNVALQEAAKEFSTWTNPPLPDFLDWCADRFVEVYRESPNVDFVQALHRVASNFRSLS